MPDTSTQVHTPLNQPLPLRARRDLKYQQMQFEGQPWIVVKDPLALEYYRMRAEQHRLLELLDGTRNLENIRIQLATEYPASRISTRDLQSLITDFSRKGLVESTRTGVSGTVLKARSKRRRKKVLATALNPFFIRLPGWDPERYLCRLYPIAGWMFRPWAVAVCSLVIVASWLHLAIRVDELHRQLPTFYDFFGWPNILLLWLTLGAAKIIHELAHGLACRHYGGECHEIGVAFLVLSPCLYCDVSDSWLLPEKRSRITIAAAGIYIEVLMSSLALFLWWWTLPGLLHYLLLNLFLVTAVTTVIFNANPLLKYDGYYMLADWLEIPNMRSKADQELKRQLVTLCTGIQLPDDVWSPEGSRVRFLLYAVAAAIYRCVLVVVVGLFLYRLLQPFGLEVLALFLTFGSLAIALCRSVVGIVKSVIEAGSESMNRMRIVTSGVAVACIVLASLTIPLPLRGHAPLVVEPMGLRNIYSQVDGCVKQILVQPGQLVVAGQPLVTLQSDSLEAEHATILNRLRQQQLQTAFYRATGDSAGLDLALKSLSTATDELSRIERQVRRLKILAPCSGVLIEPPTQSTNSLADNALLTGWQGSPLESRNHGAWLTAGSQIGSIAPNNEGWQAVLFVDQADRTDVQSGKDVEISLAHSPGRILRGRIQKIGTREEEFAPTALSNKFGGGLPTVSDGRGGVERLTSATYRATVAIESPVTALATGMRGQARFQSSDTTLASFCHTWIRRTFSFRL